MSVVKVDFNKIKWQVALISSIIMIGYSIYTSITKSISFFSVFFLCLGIVFVLICLSSLVDIKNKENVEEIPTRVLDDTYLDAILDSLDAISIKCDSDEDVKSVNVGIDGVKNIIKNLYGVKVEDRSDTMMKNLKDLHDQNSDDTITNAVLTLCLQLIGAVISNIAENDNKN